MEGDSLEGPVLVQVNSERDSEVGLISHEELILM